MEYFVEYNLHHIEDVLERHRHAGGKAIVGKWAGLYALGKLRIDGVINVPGSTLLFYSRRQNGGFAHFSLNTDTLIISRFVETPGGDFAAGTFLCVRSEDLPKRRYFELVHYYPTQLEMDGANPQILGVFRTSRQRLEEARAQLAIGCRFKDVYYGTIHPYSFAQFMASVPEYDTHVDFFRSRDDALRARKSGALSNPGAKN
jgi:hypothetical protein